MATYQNNPDYQTYQTNPYQLPTQQITQAIATRNTYWDSAASSLKNAYQNYMGLQLTNGANQEKLNGLMDGVNDNLKKVTATDLSLGENYGKAMGIFDPIIKDQNIMGDNAITKSGQQQLQLGMQARTTNNGKDYNEASMKEISNHLSDFSKSDPNNWRQFYNNRPQYTPYTDYSAEKRAVDKNFKPDTTDFTTPQLTSTLGVDGKPEVDSTGKLTGRQVQTGYMLNTHDKSILASQYRAYLDSSLSSKAKDQMALEGRVQYHDNPDALAKDYGDHISSQIESTKLHIEDLRGKMAGSNATPAQKEVIQDEINRLSGENQERTLQKTKLDAHDYSELLPYKDQIAGNLHTANLINYMSEAAARRDITVKYSTDQTWREKYMQGSEDVRQVRSLDFKNAELNERAREADLNRQNKLEVQLMRSGLSKNGKALSPVWGTQNYDIATEANTEEFGPAKFADMKSQSETDYQKSIDTIDKIIKGENSNWDSMSKTAQESTKRTFFDNSKNKALIDGFKDASSKHDTDTQVFNSMDNFIANTIKTKYPDIYNAKQNVINTIPSGQTLGVSEVSNRRSNLSGYGGGAPLNQSLNLSKDDIQKIIAGTHPNMRLSTVTEMASSTQPGIAPQPISKPVLIANGKTYDFGNGVLRDAMAKADATGQDFGNKRAEILNQNITRIAGITEFIGDEKKNPIARAIKQESLNLISGGASGVIKDEDLRVVQGDAAGNVYVTLNGDAKINPKAIADKISSIGGQYIKSKDMYMLPANRFGDLTKQASFSDPRLENMDKLVRLQGIINPTARYELPTLKYNSRNFTFQVTSIDGHPTFNILDKDTGAQFTKDPSGGQPFRSLDDAAIAASSLGSMPQDAYMNFVKTVGHGN